MLEHVMPWVGQASFLLSALAWSMRDVVWLRLKDMSSGLLGIAYNSFLAIHADPATADELWKIVGWLCLFFTINAYRSIKLLVENVEVALPEHDRRLGAAAFPSMRSRDLRDLLTIAKTDVLEDGAELLRRGDECGQIWCITEGSLIESLPDGSTRRLPCFSLVGEASWVIRDQYGGSPAGLAAHGQTTMVKWSYADLDTITASRPDIRAAITDGALRGMVKKRQFLRNAETFADDPVLSLPDKRLHALTFPSLRAGAFALMLAKVKRVALRAGEEVDNAGQLMAIERGEIRVDREDGHYLYLGPSRLIGDIAFCSAERFQSVRCRLMATQDTRLVCWDVSELDALASTNPDIYAMVVRDVGSELALKLTLPMAAVDVSPLAKQLSA